MPKRPDQHKIEDLSRIKFQLDIPRRWVFRDKDKDYGVDGEVELFDLNDNAQGLQFYVQLKATESKDESTIMNVDLKIDTLNYFRKLDIPVMLIRYSEFKDCIYHKWINNIDLTFTKRNAKTIRIKLDEDDLWTTKSPDKIESELFNRRKLKYGNFNFPIPMTLIITENNINGYSKSILQIKIKQELNQYADYFYIKNLDSSPIKVTINKEILFINMSNLTGCTFHGLDSKEQENFVQIIIQDILLGVAVCLKEIGQVDKCGKIIFENNLQNKLIENKELSYILLSALFNSSYFEKVIELMDFICEKDNSTELALISNISILTNSKTLNESKIKAIETFLKNRIQTSLKNNNISQIGVSHYNLGNFYRGQGSFYDSAKNYIAAKRFEPKYLNQNYYFHELAGVFFLLGKYQVSTNLYFKAINLGANGLTKVLYADALLYSGRYQESIETFLEYLEETEDINDEFQLKFLCLRYIVEKREIKTQIRRINEANALSTVTNGGNLIEQKQRLNNALDCDLLCGLAWFNLGIIHIEELNYEDAMFSFIMAAIIQDNDIESWINATISSISLEEDVRFIGLIIKTAYFFNKEDYLQQLYEYFETKSGITDISHITELIEKILPTEERKSVTPTVRVLNENGIFENIFEK